MSNQKEFSGLRSLIWPIYNSELTKFLPMAIILFCMLFNYTIVRNMKDTLIINSAGAGVISFLKLYCVTPSAILFLVGFIKLSSIFDKEKIFYVIIIPFLLFFVTFAFLIYPNTEFFHPSKENVEYLITTYPAFQGFINIYAYWSYSLFFVLAELWGSVGIQILFWQFANQVVPIEQSKRFYALFLTIGQIALVLCGLLADYLANGVRAILPEGYDVWQFSLTVQMCAVATMGILSMILYRFLNVSVLTKETINANSPKKEKKKKPGLMESLKLIAQSRYLGLIALLVMAYGMSVNLLEVQWKNQVGVYFQGDKAGFNAFMNTYSMWTGIFGIIFGWCAATGLLRKLSWFSAAVITPTIILIGGSIFFAGMFSGDLIKELALNPITVAVFSGAFVVAASKVVKYSLFDSTKSMAYIPLDVELKTKGMAAVEVVGGRAGKAGGALIQSIMLMILVTKDIVTIAPYSAVIFVIVCILWVYAVKALSKDVAKALKNNKK